MKCFQCGRGKVSAVTAPVVGQVRGEPLTVRVEALVCARCGFQALTDPQSSAYTAAISDAYRRKHGLLTSSRLRSIRRKLGMSQRAFAGYLGVGSASVKRWEAGLIQDAAMDTLIRLKTDLRAARHNVREVERRTAERRDTR